MVSLRQSANKLGCLFSLLLVVTVAYFGVNVGEVYLRYFEFKDALLQEARFAARRSDDDIRTRLVLVADSLGLPEAAGHVRVRRASNRISLSSSYYERVEMPLIVRDILFSPQAEWTY